MKLASFLKKHFLQFCITAGVLVLWLTPATASFLYQNHSLAGDGHLRLENIHTGKILDIQFKDEAWYDFDAIDKINDFLKCRKTGKITVFDLKLLNLIDYLQDHFDVEKVQVVSAYRSPELNEELRRRGHRVGQESYHMKGRAMDVRLVGISGRELRNHAISLESGGVGYYPGRAFVHVDTGPPRRW